jgi:hypothetical protein
MSLNTFYYSRYHFIIDLLPAQKIDHLKKGIENHGSVLVYGFKYKFHNTSDMVVDGERIIMGSLVKYDPAAPSQVVDEATGKITNTVSPNKVLAISHFVIHTKTSQIAFTTVPNFISKTTFTDVFSKLITLNNSYPTPNKIKVISMSPINFEYSFVEKVEAIKKIKRITITIVPSNPHFGEHWEKIDKDLKDRNISLYKEFQQNKTDKGIEIDEETKAKFLMSEDGYGDSIVEGENELGNPVTVSTQQKDRQESLPIEMNERTSPAVIARRLLVKFLSIGQRAKDDDKS